MNSKFLSTSKVDLDDPNHEYSNWCNLPDIVLEEIFSDLSVKDRYYASLISPQTAPNSITVVCTRIKVT